jgi:hypothetical protein
MKKSIKMFVIITVVLATLAFTGITACASNYEAQADSLHDMGLFMGADSGYELDRSPTRAEAAVMLVRLLGKEADVQAGSFENPFTDVPSWAENYVGYLYESSLTNGTSGTTFSPYETCSAQMFSAFVLRALGYSEDSGDFTYAQAQEFAAEIGLFGADSENDAFLRDDIAGMSYAALFQQMNDDSSEILLEKLVSQNAVDAAAAQKYLDYYNTYQDYLAASSAYEQSAGIKIGIDSAIIMTVDGVTQEITQTTESSIVLKAGDLVMKQVGTTDLAGSTTEFTSYFADGWLYMDTAVGKFKYQYPIDLSTAIEQAGISKAEPFYLIDSIKKTETADGASYTMTYSVTAVNSLIGSSLSQLSVSSETVGIQCRSLSTVFHFDTEGILKSIDTSADLSMQILSDGQTISMDMSVQSTSTILEFGNTVTVTLPNDLDTYTELDLT